MEDEFCRNRPTAVISPLNRDSRRRTLAKTLVYRMVAIALLAAITYYYTGSAGEATLITILFNATGTIAYYGLERLWESIPWGRGKLESTQSQEGRLQGGPSLASVPAEAIIVNEIDAETDST